MIILDTNVISEFARPMPSEAVRAWIDRQPAEALYTTAITEAELHYGIALLPKGRRQSELDMRVRRLLDTWFKGRVLAFDSPAAVICGRLAAKRRSEGRAVGQYDAQIAAIALAHGASLASRDRGFTDSGLDIVDPWDFAA